MRYANMTVRGAIQSDLPSIERHYGPLDNVGDPFCDVTKIQEVRFDWLAIGNYDVRVRPWKEGREILRKAIEAQGLLPTLVNPLKL